MMRLTGDEALRLALRNVADRSSYEMRTALRRGAELVLNESIKNSPVDTGDLENGHFISESRGDRNRIEIDIGVSSIHGDYDYAMEMHEGSYNLGKKSIQKNFSSQNMVGPKYLERAYEDNQDLIKRNIAAELMRFF